MMSRRHSATICSIVAVTTFVSWICFATKAPPLQIYPRAKHTTMNNALTSQRATVSNWADTVNFSPSDRLQRVRECLSTISKTRIDSGRSHTLWSDVHIQINRCGLGEFEMLDFVRNHVDKLFLPLKGIARANSASDAVPRPHLDPYGPADPAPCVVVTLGIGGDTTMEHDMASHYPQQCRFYGADPTPSVSQGFRKYGQYYPVAVDDSSHKTQKISIMATNNTNGRYKPVDLPSIGLENFLSLSVSRESMVHFVSMDIEGAEYRILSLLARMGRLATVPHPGAESFRKLPPICQIAIECHGPLAVYDMTADKFGRLFHDFVTHSDFVPIRSYSPGTHHRFLAVNAESKECLDALSFSRDRNADSSLYAKGPVGKSPEGILFPTVDL